MIYKFDTVEHDIFQSFMLILLNIILLLLVTTRRVC